MSEARAFLDGRVVLHPGDCREVLRGLADASIDSVVTDPPYALVSIGKRFGKPGAAPTRDGDVYSRASAGFMGQQWDTGETAFSPAFWAEVLRVLKPGGHVVAFSGTRTYHRMVCAIEDAGFEIRDQLAWIYGSGFPKSHDVSKAIDKHLGAERPVVGVERLSNDISGGALLDAAHDGSRPGFERNITAAARQWEGWGTACKPAWEPIVLARKLLSGTVAETVLAHGTGALNIDGCRVHADDAQGGAYTIKRFKPGATLDKEGGTWKPEGDGPLYQGEMKPGRWPANIVHDGSDEVVSAFPDAAGQQGVVTGDEPSSPFANVYGDMPSRAGGAVPRGDSGSAARFFYSAKADANDRIGSKHPTVKPVDLMQWLCRLVTPPGGTVLDPFAGTGTTGEAAFREGFRAVLVEREEAFQADIARRMELALAGPTTRKVASVKARAREEAPLGGLFAEAAE
ncbi:site-specific DNA-methyltransferase [Bosea sp. F3-2]|uniref:DNA-methyltransferase n=1 Tax=Bosea sp. F3-2 TaxID=2599640 RepID=UPI0011EFD688|nr:DNA methyltransferase [Bosea sp. F3-2]QEL26137.1 site-specific DNA-methyltransferase [Bosea sp. F3-2]